MWWLDISFGAVVDVATKDFLGLRGRGTQRSFLWQDLSTTYDWQTSPFYSSTLSAALSVTLFTSLPFILLTRLLLFMLVKLFLEVTVQVDSFSRLYSLLLKAFKTFKVIPATGDCFARTFSCQSAIQALPPRLVGSPLEKDLLLHIWGLLVKAILGKVFQQHLLYNRPQLQQWGIITSL